MTTKLLKSVLAAFSLAALATSAHAGVLLLDNLDLAGSRDEMRSPANGILAQIVVGAENVQIDQFGVYGRQVSGGNVRFDIFDAAANRVYDSGSISAASGAANQWYDSPLFNLTLNAGATYYFGVLSDQNFVYSWELPAGANVGIGLTSPMAGVSGSNGNFRDFANPTVNDYCCIVQQATRIFGTDPNAVDVPEPVSAALFGMGLLGLALNRRTGVKLQGPAA
jgi:hypothetical protein